TYDDAKESDDYKQVHTEGEYTLKMPLIKIAHGRSGDKGDTCNIGKEETCFGIIARHPKYYGFLKRVLTEETVRAYMSHVCKGIVKRYVVPGCYALNFVFTKSLGGGGLSSLRVDRQGKTFAQMLLSYEVEVPNDNLPLLLAGVFFDN
ncbi:4045_t:CDS:2, partial [Paraglomus occultum]